MTRARYRAFAVLTGLVLLCPLGSRGQDSNLAPQETIARAAGGDSDGKHVVFVAVDGKTTNDGSM